MATLEVRIRDLTTRIATEFKTVRTELQSHDGDLSTLKTTAKANLVAAINELYDYSHALVDDTALGTSTTKTWSAAKIAAQIQAAKDSLTNGAGAALDTLKELADAIGNDSNFAATVTAALGNRVRFDAAQTLTAPQALQARTNIGAQAASEIGNPDTDFVALFTTGLT
uniref:Tail fiber protein n=1 Tax=Caulobacter phage BL57 TaxID=3348355 RepID=A0AB74UGH8_9VIRU